MRSALLVLGLSAFFGVAMTPVAAAAAGTPVGKVLKKAQEEARRREAGEPPPKPEKAPAVKRPVKVTISKETTYITSPLRPDGYPDYVAALDAIAARGVTPENNAVVLLVQAFGPKAIREEHREQYFKKLGIPPLPEDGPYFVPLGDYLDRLREKRDALLPPEGEDPFDQYVRAMDHPWSDKDCPLLAGWLKANEKPLALIVEALQRPRYYDPWAITSGVPLMRLGCGKDIGRMRDIAWILQIRAMRLLHEGNATGAWRELSLAHRLPPLIAQSPVLVDLLVANTVRRTVLSAQRSLLHSGKYTAAQLRAMRAEISVLPALPQIADRLDIYERFTALDAACRAAREGYTSWDCLWEPETYKEPPGDALRNWLLAGQIDWNEVLRRVNDFTDRFVAAGRQPLFRERQTALGELYPELGELDRKVATRVPRLFEAIDANPTRFQGTEQVAAYLIVYLTMPGLRLMVWEYETATQVQLTDLAFGLSLYRAERGAYPERLGQLVPKYVAEMPKDLYSGAALRYQREGTGYLLYSLGPNGKDDGGRGRHMDPPPDDDGELPEDADDIGFRMPALDKPAGKAADKVAGENDSETAALKAKIDALARPLIEKKTAVGFVVGIIHNGRSHVFGYGRVAKDSQETPDGKTVYEIGSITKVFTGLLLADAVEKKRVALDDPVAKYLPADVKVPTKDGRAITLLDLATHTSGLPRLPDNLLPQIDKNPHNPYAKYTVDDLYNFLSSHKLRRTPGEKFEYSNLGAGLLGHALARRARRSYEVLVLDHICAPLGMKDTCIELPADMRRRLAPGHDAAGKPGSNWDIPTLAGGGALRSTVNDMLVFMKANLRADAVGLAAAIRISHVPRRDIDKEAKMALGWHIRTKEGIYWHNGQTGGYHSYLGLHPASGNGVVVLSNSATGAIDEVGVKVLKMLVADGKGAMQ